MNRVLRSPEISDKPYVISARTAEHSVTVEEDDEDAPQGHDPAEEGETGTSDPETPGLSENDSAAATDGDPSKGARDDSASEGTQDDAGTGSEKADGTSSTDSGRQVRASQPAPIDVSKIVSARKGPGPSESVIGSTVMKTVDGARSGKEDGPNGKSEPGNGHPGPSVAACP